MNQLFAPGCGLKIYNNEASMSLLKYLKDSGLVDKEHTVCCRHEPQLKAGSHIINVCSGCDKRFSTLYEGITTISLWEVLVDREDFPFPDYNGMVMSIHDACPTRKKTAVHQAVRKLLEKMNIKIIESAYSGTRAFCCGDNLHGRVPNELVFDFMKKRADSMPCEDVVVYCTSCTKAMVNGGKKPRYLVDLLLGLDTVVEDANPDTWHKILDAYIRSH